jgi:hypothetical protein
MRQQVASGAVSTIPDASCSTVAVDYAWAQNAEIPIIHEREDMSIARRKMMKCRVLSHRRMLFLNDSRFYDTSTVLITSKISGHGT